MTPVERRIAAMAVLIALEPTDAHEEKCPARREHPGICTCYLIRNAQTRAAALDDAGLLCALAAGGAS